MARRLQGKDEDEYDVEESPDPVAPHEPDMMAPPPEGKDDKDTDDDQR
jgi:hypothetical protein